MLKSVPFLDKHRTVPTVLVEGAHGDAPLVEDLSGNGIVLRRVGICARIAELHAMAQNEVLRELLRNIDFKPFEGVHAGQLLRS